MGVGFGFLEICLLDDEGIFQVRFDCSDECSPLLRIVPGDRKDDQDAQDTNRDQ